MCWCVLVDPFISGAQLIPTKLLFLATFSIRPATLAPKSTGRIKSFLITRTSVEKPVPENGSKLFIAPNISFFLQCVLGTFSKTKSFELLPRLVLLPVETSVMAIKRSRWVVKGAGGFLEWMGKTIFRTSWGKCEEFHAEARRQFESFLSSFEFPVKRKMNKKIPRLTTALNESPFHSTAHRLAVSVTIST